MSRECRALYPSRLFEHIACGNLGLRPGDGLLILPGVFHRTHDYRARRSAVTLDLCSSSSDGTPACRQLPVMPWLGSEY